MIILRMGGGCCVDRLKSILMDEMVGEWVDE